MVSYLIVKYFCFDALKTNSNLFLADTAGDVVDSRESTSVPAALVSPMSLPAMQTHVELHVVPDNTQAAASGEELLQVGIFWRVLLFNAYCVLSKKHSAFC